MRTIQLQRSFSFSRARALTVKVIARRRGSSSRARTRDRYIDTHTHVFVLLLYYTRESIPPFSPGDNCARLFLSLPRPPLSNFIACLIRRGTHICARKSFARARERPSAPRLPSLFFWAAGSFNERARRILINPPAKKHRA